MLARNLRRPSILPRLEGHEPIQTPPLSGTSSSGENFAAYRISFRERLISLRSATTHARPRPFQRGHDHLFDQFGILFRAPVADQIFTR